MLKGSFKTKVLYEYPNERLNALKIVLINHAGCNRILKDKN